MRKCYAVLYSDDEFAFPVKQEFDPYIQQEEDRDVHSFCWGCPQFFGGTLDDDETIVERLRDEISEESALSFTLLPGPLTLFYDARHEGNTYEFFCTRAWKPTDINWPSEASWRLLPARYREMCWVGGANRTAFAQLPVRPTQWDILQALIDAMPQNAPQWAIDQMVTYPVERLAASQSADAFDEFVRRWLANELP
ncbi:MAG TPA: hypothetical protein VGG48_19730 [Rhizomicrobium sp.]|jgi:hypothetical protein